AVVTSWSSRNRLPALGPRLTTSRADPAGSDSTAPACASAGDSLTSGVSPLSSPPTLGMTLVDSPTRSWESAAPHCAQKRLPSGFWWPHRVQCTLRLLRCRGHRRGPWWVAAGGRRTADRSVRRGSAAVGSRRAVGHGTSGRPGGQPNLQGEAGAPAAA